MPAERFDGATRGHTGRCAVRLTSRCAEVDVPPRRGGSHRRLVARTGASTTLDSRAAHGDVEVRPRRGGADALLDGGDSSPSCSPSRVAASGPSRTPEPRESIVPVKPYLFGEAGSLLTAKSRKDPVAPPRRSPCGPPWVARFDRGSHLKPSASGVGRDLPSGRRSRQSELLLEPAPVAWRGRRAGPNMTVPDPRRCLDADIGAHLAPAAVTTTAKAISSRRITWA